MVGWLFFHSSLTFKRTLKPSEDKKCEAWELPFATFIAQFIVKYPPPHPQPSPWREWEACHSFTSDFLPGCFLILSGFPSLSAIAYPIQFPWQGRPFEYFLPHCLRLNLSLSFSVKCSLASLAHTILLLWPSIIFYHIEKNNHSLYFFFFFFASVVFTDTHKCFMHIYCWRHVSKWLEGREKFWLTDEKMVFLKLFGSKKLIIWFLYSH